MKVKKIIYSIIIPSFHSIDYFDDMFRYSGDEIIESKIENNIKIYKLEHKMYYENKEHLGRCIKFFNTQIIPRWKSFGAEIKEIGEII